MTNRDLINGIDHISLHIENLEKSKEFYADILGLDEIPRPNFDFDGAWYSIGKTQQIHLICGREAEVNSHNRGTHIAIHTKDIHTLVKNILDSGWNKIKPVKKRIDGQMHSFITDPDGYYIEIVQQ